LSKALQTLLPKQSNAKFYDDMSVYILHKGIPTSLFKTMSEKPEVIMKFIKEMNETFPCYSSGEYQGLISEFSLFKEPF